MSRSKLEGKPFDISKGAVVAAFERVKENRGAAGVDDVSIAEFEADLDNNLYKVWNRMSSGSYFPPPVKAVEIPKYGGVRTLGVPTVADRVAQTVVKLYLEPVVEPMFHEDSYGYRPGRSAHDCVAVCRKRCWRSDWVIDLDIESFFDSVRHDLALKAVAHHCDLPWVLLYVERWLKAPLQERDGTLVVRDRGTPQGSAISPLIANLYLHFAFDRWMAAVFPSVRFERYCDDAVVHCDSEAQAVEVLEAIGVRMAEVGLGLHEGKTKIVYCKDDDRPGDYRDTAFEFLGFGFRPRRARNRYGTFFVSFLPAIGDRARKSIGARLRSWTIGCRSDKSLDDLARMFNPVIQGWINYFGRFYKSMLYPILRRINEHLVDWAMQKFKRLRRHRTRAIRWLAAVARRVPDLFAHWRYGLKPDGWTRRAG